MGNMKLKKWDPDRHCYDPHPYPDDWRVSFYCADMDELVKQAESDMFAAKREFYRQSAHDRRVR